MSTKNIPQLAQQRGALRNTGRDVRDRAAVVREALADLDAVEKDVRIGAEAVVEDIDNDRRLLVEEGEQLAAIVGRARGISLEPPTEPGPELSAGPQAAFDLRVEGSTHTIHVDASRSRGRNLSYGWDFGDGRGRLAPSSSPRGRVNLPDGHYEVSLVVTDDEGRTDEERQEITIGHSDVPPAQAPTTVEVVPPAQAPAAPHVMDVRCWTPVQWLLAVVGALVGVVVATQTWSPLFADIPGPGRGLLVTLWYISLVGLGFGSGGWIGSRVDRHHGGE